MQIKLAFFCTLLFVASLFAQQSAPPASSSTEAMYAAQAQRCQQKFDRIRQNGAKQTPDQTPTVITENEINAWLSSGQAELPKGVRKLQFRGEPGVINATAQVDFDEVTAGRTSNNPLLSLFRGVHTVDARAHASGSGGSGQVHIDSVSLDGVAVPHMAMEFFVDKYIKPKYSNLGIDSQFPLPNKIDTAQVGSRQLSVTQK